MTVVSLASPWCCEGEEQTGLSVNFHGGSRSCVRWFDCVYLWTLVFWIRRHHLVTFGQSQLFGHAADSGVAFGGTDHCCLFTCR